MAVAASAASVLGPHDAAPPRGLLLVGAFGLVYLAWGSTFLAIRYAVETIPPFLLMGVRSLLAGLFLYAWAWWRGAESPPGREWLSALAVGSLLFLGCHGGLAWAEQRVPSGSAALVLATIPLWMALLDWAVARGPRPDASVWLGLAAGLAGLVVLIGPEGLVAGGGVDAPGLAALVAAALAWAAGSIAARSLRLPSSLVLATGMELVAGGLLLLVVSAASGEASSFDPRAVTARSALALLYLIALGSILTFTAYVWLLRVSTPARAGSYAFVNPVVAVLLGGAVGGEPWTARTGLAVVLVTAGVAALVTRRST